VGESFTHFNTAAQVAVSLLQRLKNDPLPVDTILNVNVPDVPWAELQGYEVTRLGRRHKSEPVVKMQDPRGNDIYWVGPVGAEQDAGPGTDFHALRQHRVSLTPLNVDLTRYAAMEQVSSWVQGL
jgi:5'-nucleotidase